MEEKLRKKLKEDETLLWCGTPGAFTFLDATHKSGLVKKWIGVVGVCVLVMVWYLSSIAESGIALNPVMPILVGIIAVYGCTSDWLDARKLQKKTIYGLTDQRIMVLMGDILDAVEYHNVPEYTFDTDADGHTSLICGDWPATEKPNQRRLATVRGACNNCDTGLCESIAMYALTDVDAVKRILAQKIA